MEAKGKLENIKSKFILKKIYDNIIPLIMLKLIKYNKKLQIKSGINLTNYKEFYEIIEIELIPNKAKLGKFLNIQNNEEESYYHIQFDNNLNEEIDRNYLVQNASKILIKIEGKIKSFNELFLNCDGIESVYFKKFRRNNINNMSHMFSQCSSLIKADLTNIKTDNVTTMSSMFFGCSSLKEIIFPKLNIQNLEDISYMFYGCSSLKNIDISNFNIDKIKNKHYMFFGCSKELKRKINYLINN